jgi:superfamily II DNA or RNA helicase
MLFTEQELLDTLGEARLNEGRKLLARLPLFSPDVRHGAGLITALLRELGSPEPVRVYLRVRREADGRLNLHAECSCWKKGCAHVPAVLLRALEQSLAGESSGAADSAAGAGSGAGSGATTAAQAERLLIYRLERAPEEEEDHAYCVTPQVATRRDRGFVVIGLYLVRGAQGTPPGFVTATDQGLLQRLGPFFTGQREFPYLVEGPAAAPLLDDLVATGRCLFEEQDQPLGRGEPLVFSLLWKADAAGNQWAVFEVERAVLWLNLPGGRRYIDQDEILFGELHDPFAPEVRQWLHENYLVPPERIASVQKGLDERFPNAGIPPLRQWRRQRVKAVRPRPVLHLDLWENDYSLPWLYEGEVPAAFLEFDYDGHRLADQGVNTLLEGETLYQIERKPRLEAGYRRQLTDYGLVPPGGQEGEPLVLLGPRGFDWQGMQIRLLPRLEADGWQVEVADAFPDRLSRIGALRADLRQAAGDDWFTLGLGLEVEGAEIDLAGLLLEMLRKHPQHLGPKALRDLADDQGLVLRLPDGREIGFLVERLRPILEVLYEFLQGGSVAADGGIRLDRFRTLRLGELEGQPGLEWRGHLEPLRLLERLRGVTEIPPVAPPAEFQASLRGYQQQGLNWLQFLREHGLAGVLADDMGLGKTVQALAHLLLEKQQGRARHPSLVVAPTSLMGNWRREARQFAPGLRVLTLHGADRQGRFRDIPGHDLVLTTYPLLLRDEAVLAKQPWHLLVLDEAQVIKNPKAKAGQVVRRLKAEHRLCLTGTPMENHLGELWSLFDFLLPGLLGSQDEFRRLFRKPVEQDGDQQTAARLARRVRPFLLRRTKEAVVAELPPKTEILRGVTLEGPQRDLYETIRSAVQLRVRDEVARKGLARSSIVILDALLKLRQVCCDPRLVKLDHARKTSHSAKLEMLMELLPEMLEEGRRVLLFSQFTEMLGLIEAEVGTAGIPYVKLTGQTRDRATPVDRFQNGEVPLFLISLKAGGVGLNLTAADTVIHYDPWWNPAAERQATDRAHRIGQDNPVFVYKLITEGTVEERIHALQQRKQALADSLLDRRGDAAPQWSQEDLEMLFEPLG